ncbi:urease accessory UreF family protein, partial [Streptomyces scabiei]|uniref:urease accessory protein UreF n=1 Tax=Streptomyces scabiei TaxID=1930 RepID=UPI0029BBE5AB
MSRAALLVLADGRFPAGGHAHSGGAEAAVKAGLITGAEGLEAFCRGRLHTAGLVAAGLAAAAALGVDPADLDAAADARTPSVALRGASRKLGRQLMRAARATWPSAELDALAREFPKGAHQPHRPQPLRPPAPLTPPRGQGRRPAVPPPLPPRRIHTVPGGTDQPDGHQPRRVYPPQTERIKPQ